MTSRPLNIAANSKRLQPHLTLARTREDAIPRQFFFLAARYNFYDRGLILLFKLSTQGLQVESFHDLWLVELRPYSQDLCHDPVNANVPCCGFFT